VPERIQLRRTKGWRLPPGAMSVARPTRWGNPYRVEKVSGQWTVFDSGPLKQVRLRGFATRADAAAKAVSLYRRWIDTQARSVGMIPILGGRDLACFCPLLDEYGERFPCHGDVLLLLANPGLAL
jgi:hypothetical protein